MADVNERDLRYRHDGADDTDGIYAFVECALPRTPRRIRFEVTGYPLTHIEVRMQFHCGSLYTERPDEIPCAHLFVFMCGRVDE